MPQPSRFNPAPSTLQPWATPSAPWRLNPQSSLRRFQQRRGDDRGQRHHRQRLLINRADCLFGSVPDNTINAAPRRSVKFGPRTRLDCLFSCPLPLDTRRKPLKKSQRCCNASGSTPRTPTASSAPPAATAAHHPALCPGNRPAEPSSLHPRPCQGRTPRRTEEEMFVDNGTTANVYAPTCLFSCPLPLDTRRKPLKKSLRC